MNASRKPFRLLHNWAFLIVFMAAAVFLLMTRWQGALYLGVAAAVAVVHLFVILTSHVRETASDSYEYWQIAVFEIPLMIAPTTGGLVFLGAVVTQDWLWIPASVLVGGWAMIVGMVCGVGFALLFPFRRKVDQLGVPCPACGYRIDNVPGPHCPECGRPFQHVPPWDALHPDSREERRPSAGVLESETTRADP